MASGVTLADPERIDVRGELETGQDIHLDVNVVIEGHVTLANGVSVGPNVVLRDCRIAGRADRGQFHCGAGPGG